MTDHHAIALEQAPQPKVSPREHERDNEEIQKLTADIFSINDAMKQPEISSTTRQGLEQRLVTAQANFSREIARVLVEEEQEQERTNAENNENEKKNNDTGTMWTERKMASKNQNLNQAEVCHDNDDHLAAAARRGRCERAARDERRGPGPAADDRAEIARGESVIK